MQYFKQPINFTSFISWIDYWSLVGIMLADNYEREKAEEKNKLAGLQEKALSELKKYA